MDSIKQLKILLIKLHCLYKEGKNDSEEADKIRDLCDPIWYKLTIKEQEEIAEYSEELYNSSTKNNL